MNMTISLALGLALATMQKHAAMKRFDDDLLDIIRGVHQRPPAETERRMQKLTKPPMPKTPPPKK